MRKKVLCFLLFGILLFFLFSSCLNIQYFYVNSKVQYKARYITIDNNLAYITSDPGGLFIYNISVYDPYPIGNFDEKGHTLQDLYVENDFAYLADGQNLLILNISDPRNIMEKYHFNLNGDCLEVFKSDDLVFVAAASKGFYIFNVSNIDNIHEIYHNEQYEVRGIYSENNILYITDSNKLILFNSTDIQNISEIATYHSDQLLFKIDKSENYLHIICFDGKIEIIDVSNPSNPIKTSNYTTPGNIEEIDCVGKYTYIANANMGFSIANNSDISSPKIISNLELLGYYLDVDTLGNKVYLTSDSGRIYILNVAYPTAPCVLNVFSLEKPVNPIRNMVIAIVLGISASILLAAIAFVVYKKREKIKEWIIKEIEKAGKMNRKDKVFLIVGLVFFLSALAVSIAFFIYFFKPINSTSYSLVVVHIVMWLINVVVGTIIISNTKKGSNVRIIGTFNLVVGVIFAIIGGFLRYIMFIS